MEVLAKATVAIAVMPIIGSGVAIADTSQLLAQTVIPTNNTTQAIISDQGVIDISGGTQSAGNLVHRFDQFNIDNGQTANFITNSLTDAVIGQVIGGTASTLDGLLKITGSNADLYLINPTGLLFGPNAQLDLGGSFTATTASHFGTHNQWFDILSTTDYNSLVTAPSHFGFSNSGAIVNHGQLAVNSGQSLRLLAPQITNTGTLSAPDGEITLLATEQGTTIHLEQTDGLLSLEILPKVTEPEMLPAMITGGNSRHSNTLVIGDDGEATLVHRDLLITPQLSGNLSNAGNLSTQGTTGGEINILGQTIHIGDGTLNASGRDGSGSIRIGGDYQGQGLLPHATHVNITAHANLIADSIHGHAGEVIVWSDGTTIFDGKISAQSTNGNGGLVETSGLHQLTIGETASVTTAAAVGDAGLWLIDPLELNIVDTGGSGMVSMGNNDALNTDINASTIVSALDSTNVTLQATNSITVNAGIDATSNNATHNLFFDTNTLNLNETIILKDSGELSGSANTVNVGSHGKIQNGIDAVATGGTVNLAASTYREGQTITIAKPLSLTGQGQDSTYISGDSDNNNIGNHRVLEITDTGDNVTLTNLTIQDGLSLSDGAGLRNLGNNVEISDVTFTNNEVAGNSQDGGAIQNRGLLTLRGTTFENNRTGSDGGAIDILQGSVTVIDSIFTNNQSGEHAGAIDVDPNGTLNVVNSEFSLNTASTHGGAIFSEGDVTIDTAIFMDNQANESGGAVLLDGDSIIRTSQFLSNTAKRGGGIYNQNELTLLDSTIASNRAIGTGNFDSGGGLYNTAGGNVIISGSLISDNTSLRTGGGILNLSIGSETIITISNSSIVSNQANTLGGGLHNSSTPSFPHLSQLNITNSTISNNQAFTGGGIRTVGPTSLTNVTIADNIASSSGGGISENTTTASIPTLINTIVASNNAFTNPDVEGQFDDQGHNLIGINQGSQGFDITSLVGTITTPLDPELTSLNNSLGSLPSHQLLSKSPAANSGNNSAATAVDQHGQPRVVGGTVDIGAVESNISPNIIPISSQEDSIESPPPVQTPELAPELPASPPHPQVSQPSPLTVEQPQTENLPAMSMLEVDIDKADFLIQEERTVHPLNPKPTTRIRTQTEQVYHVDEEAFQYLEDSFSQDYEDYWQLPPTQQVTLQSVQQTLHQANQAYQVNSAIIYAVFVPQEQTANNAPDKFVLPRTHKTPKPDDKLLLILVPSIGQPIQHLVDVSRAELIQQAKLFRLAASDPDDLISYQALARQIYGWLLAPLQEDLASQHIHHIIYSLDQGLRTIPLAAMMQEDTFVIEQYGLSIIPSMGLTRPQFEHVSSTPRSLVAGANKFEAFDNLPAVPIEINIVAKSVQASEILFNETFTLENFLNLQRAQKPNLLHLATHAEFNAGNVDQSFIQFWDSPLTFRQMRELSWPELELLILSACDTALSSPEAELGFTGLATAAGIETSMGSLWNVSDIGTLALMTEFYSQLPNPSLRFQKLQTAQLSLIRGETHINNNTLITSQDNIELPADWNLPTTAKFSHPFYWAGFTMVGNPWH